MPLLRSRRAAPRTLLAAALLAPVAGCGAGEEPIPPASPGFAVLNVTPRSITAIPGDTVRLRLTDERGRSVRANAAAASFTAATVTLDGLVTALTPGSSLVTLTVLAGGRTMAVSVPVTVLGTFRLDPARATVAAVGGTVVLRPVFVGDSAALGALTWSSSDTAMVTVAADGTARGVGAGVARITAVAAADPRVRAVAEVVAVPCCGFPTSLTVQPAVVTLPVGGTRQLETSVTLAPGSPPGTSRGATYASNDTTVATVSAEGLVTGRRAGTAVITVASAAYPLITQAVAVTVTAP